MDKDFNTMTADEIRNYEGPVWWAQVEHIAADNQTVIRSDFESTTPYFLAEKLRSVWAGLRVLNRGAKWKLAGGHQSVEWIPKEGIDYFSHKL